jgi:L-seryl-tRNA(Ser) seleniumtransferase
MNGFRELPSVHEVLERLEGATERYPRAMVVAEVRRVLEEMRAEIRGGQGNPLAVEARVERALTALEEPSLRHVINATGVVLHTNLGRAPLGPMTVLPGYSNLEYDLAAGRRGKRDGHAGALLERLLGAPAIAVNNNAAAIFLALNELAGSGEVLISRGELIEIGDGFRIPEIMSRSGVTLREVGATNRTTVADYRAAVGGNTRLLLRVHPSNFRMSGFTARPELSELVALGRETGIPVFEDLGSGCVTDLRPFGIDEPLAADSLRTGADLISFSGDKLLGGPQAGILAGKPEIVARLRRNPLFRVLRLDKLVCQALEQTLRRIVLERWEEIPAIAMIRQTAERIRERAEALLQRIPGVAAQLIQGRSVIGGGATPDQSLPTWLIALAGLATETEKRLRANHPPVVARIEKDRLVIDLRTVLQEEEEALAQALQPDPH